jgi:hypothetical protein
MFILNCPSVACSRFCILYCTDVVPAASLGTHTGPVAVVVPYPYVIYELGFKWCKIDRLSDFLLLHDNIRLNYLQGSSRRSSVSNQSADERESRYD